MLSAATAYIVLAISPLVVNLTPNPVLLYWAFKGGGQPMSPTLRQKAEQAARHVLFLVYGCVALLVLGLMVRHQVSLADVGLHLHRWTFHLSLGCGAGLFWLGLHRILLRLVGVFASVRGGTADHYLQKGTATFWVSLFFVGAFVEEFWRGFCLFALTAAGHSAASSVILTAIAFGASHLRAGVSRAFGTAIFGLYAAFLFLWLGSLAATYPAHFIVDVGGLYWIRRAQHHAGT